MLATVLTGCAPSAADIQSTLDRVGAPPGFVLDQARTEVKQTPPYVRRAYTGKGSTDAIRSAMIARLRAAGFSDAHWRDGDGQSQAPGVLGTNDGLLVFVRINQTGDDAIDIEAYPT